MSLPPGPPPPAGPGRRVPALAIAAALCIALISDGVAVNGLQELRSAWGDWRLPGSSASASPTPTKRGGTAASPALTPSAGRSSTPTPRPTSGEVKVTDALRRGVVLITAESGNTTSAGTGMILTAEGQVLTNYHVVRGSSSITVEIAASERRFQATLVGRDATRDVALLQLRGASGLNTITPDGDPVGVGDPVVAAGNAGGQGFITAYAGVITAMDRRVRVRADSENEPEEDLTGMLESNAHAEPGDSGGPLFDAQDQVLGMTTAGSGNSTLTPDATAYAVPIGKALAVVDQIRSGDESGTVVIGPKASLGIYARNDGASGVRVTAVTGGSAADKAGIAAGDHVVSVAGKAVATTAELSAALDGIQPGASVTVVWTTADGQRRSARIALDASRYN